MHLYRKCWFDPFEEQFISLFLSDCPSLMLGIAIHCIQPSQAMLESGVCELAHSFFHFLIEWDYYLYLGLSRSEGRDISLLTCYQGIFFSQIIKRQFFCYFAMWTKTLGNVDVILKDLHVEMLCTLIKSSFLPTNRKKTTFF